VCVKPLINAITAIHAPWYRGGGGGVGGTPVGKGQGGFWYLLGVKKAVLVPVTVLSKGPQQELLQYLLGY